jgi:hypothetical protein
MASGTRLSLVPGTEGFPFSVFSLLMVRTPCKGLAAPVAWLGFGLQMRKSW